MTAKPNVPKLELTFHDVAGDPWEGRATPRFNDEPGEPFAVREGMTGKERGEVRWYIEEFMDLPEGGNVVRAREVEQGLEAFGRRLWEGLSGPTAERWLGAVQRERAGRLELRAATERDEVAFRTPWELLRVGEKKVGGRLLHQLGVDVVRRVDAYLPRLPVPDTSKGLRILAIVCRPEEVEFLDPRFTPEAILDALADRPEVEVDFCRPGTLKALLAALETARSEGRPFHVVHFDGHGTTLAAEGGVGALCFEDYEGNLDLVRAGELGRLLSRHDIPLVVLEACRTATKFAQDTVAGALLRHGVGTVVAMGHAVHVDLTRELMAGFYEGIGEGAALGEALQAARNRVYAQADRRTRIVPDAPTVTLHDWFVPQLYQGCDDPRLLPRKPPRRQRPEPIFEGFPPAPRAGFQGRGHELHRLERAVGSHRVVVVHAPGGMGKTALAREAAHWWVRTGFFPDGAIFVTLEGNHSPDRLEALVGEALVGLEFHQKEDGAAWLADQLRRRRLLLVWDNYESVLPAFNAGRPPPPEFADLATRWTAGGSRLLVTCRGAEVGFEARPFALGELNRIEGLMLLVGYLDRLGIDRRMREELEWTEETLEPIVRRTDGHPLSLELLAPFLPSLGPERVENEIADLMATAQQDHNDERNRSLAASLDFSIRHLSPWARAVLPGMALLAGGCLEGMAQTVFGLEPEAWAAVRGELESTGLVRVEEFVLRPHPALAEVVGPRMGRVTRDLEEQFLTVVESFARAFEVLVRTSDAQIALTAMDATEAMARRAVERAAAGGRLDLAWSVADSLNLFLQLTGRAAEGGRLIAELRECVGRVEEGINPVAAALIREAAWARAAGEPAAAISELETLLGHLRGVHGWDPRQERAATSLTLGRVFYIFAGNPEAAVLHLEQAARLYGELEPEGNETTNRAAALADLANTACTLGRLPEALAAAEEALRLDRGRDDPSAAARAEASVAQILTQQGRLGEAEERYRLALECAQAAGDEEAAATIWQHLGNLAIIRNRHAEAIGPLKRALDGFQRAGDDHGRMRVFNLLGNAEGGTGRHNVAIEWYERSLAMAMILGDLAGQAQARNNRAIDLSKLAEQAQDPAGRRRLLNEAIAEGREALGLFQQVGNPDAVAASHSSLANRLRMAGKFDEAEQHALRALEIHQRLDAPDGHLLSILAAIAEARGDATTAAEWRRQSDEARAEAQRRAGPDSLPQEFVVSLLQLALTVRVRKDLLADALREVGADDPDAVLAFLDQNHPWLAAHLRALAGGTGRPQASAPPPYPALLDQAWQAAEGGGG